MTTPILKIPEAADGSVNQYLVLNEGLRALESAGNDFYSVDLSTGNVTLPDVAPNYVFSRYFFFRTTGNTVSRILTVPASKRLFAVQNSGSAALTVKRGTTEIIVPAAGAFLFYCDGTADGLIGIAGGAGGGAAEDTFDTVTIASGAIDLSTYQSVWLVNLTANVTSITLPVAATGKVLSTLILFKQDAIGGHTVTGWGSVLFESGAEPAIDTTAESVTSVPVLVLGNGDIYVVG